MKNQQFRNNIKESSEFENDSHISRKKKATAKVFRDSSKQKEVLEFGLEAEDELETYKYYLK